MTCRTGNWPPVQHCDAELGEVGWLDYVRAEGKCGGERGDLEATVSVTGKRSTYRYGFCSFSKLLFHGSSNLSRGWRQVCLSSSLLLILKSSEGRTSPKVVLRCFVLLTN